MAATTAANMRSSWGMWLVGLRYLREEYREHDGLDN